jgi:tetratricopeptide (TPR) repeat protein
LRRTARYAEALTQIERAHRLEPVSALISGNLVDTYRLVGDRGRAIEFQRKRVELYPERDGLRALLADCYAENGLFDEAFAELALEASPDERLWARGYIHALAGDRVQALKAIEEIESSEGMHPQARVRRPLFISTALGDHDEAFASLQRWEDLTPRLSRYAELNTIPELAPLRDDSRYKAMLRSVGLEP